MKFLGALLGMAAAAATVLLLSSEPGNGAVATADEPGSRQAAGEFLSSDRNHRPAAATQDRTAVAQATERVMGLNVRTDRRCNVTRHYLDRGDGTVSEAYSCDAPDPVAGEFEQYDNGTLEQLAYSDARAASALGKRLLATDPAKARALILRALALQPRDIEPVMWLVSQAYSLRGSSTAARGATANAYVLTRLVRELGTPVALTWIVEDLRRSGFDDAALASLDAGVAAELSRLEDIRREVFGDSLIREDRP
jgi:hypothetical protein